METAVAFNVVPLAVAKPSQEVEVPLVKDEFVVVLFVANKLVVVADVEVTFVKMAVEGVVAPMVVPSIVPPLIVTFCEVRLLIEPLPAFNVVPLAVAKPSQEVEVPLVKDEFVAVLFVANKFVLVVFVPVALVQVRLVGVRVPADKLVIVPFVAKKSVVVTFVVVTLPISALKRIEEEPRDSAMSPDGRMNPPDAASVRLPLFLLM